MAEVARVKIEVERVVNLITALGWDKVEERVDDDTITLVVKKKITAIGEE
ncbi:hypothetical protein ES702_05944 [subsurface metagenome]